TEYHRVMLEEAKELSGSMLRAINAQLAEEKKKSEQLLHNILPHDVAEELKRTGRVEPVYYDSVSVLFTDFKDFTRVAGRLSPAELIKQLDFYFSEFDRIVERHGLEKLKTIGDAYMCAGGVPTPNTTHAVDAVAAAWEIQRFAAAVLRDRQPRGEPCW